MGHVSLKNLLSCARKQGYGVPSLLCANLDMALGLVAAAEECRSPLILSYNGHITPFVPMDVAIPMMVNLAKRASVPIASRLDHGLDFDTIVKAIHLGVSSVMYDGSTLSYEENVRNTREVVKIAHAVGVSVEAEIGSLAGTSVVVDSAQRTSGQLTDPDQAADFVTRTGIDALAISFGNAHGKYHGRPSLDLDRVKKIFGNVDVPLVMHGASGLPLGDYRQIADSGISEFCYYFAMGKGCAEDVRKKVVAAGDNLIFHHTVEWNIQAFKKATADLMQAIGSIGKGEPLSANKSNNGIVDNNNKDVSNGYQTKGEDVRVLSEIVYEVIKRLQSKEVR